LRPAEVWNPAEQLLCRLLRLPAGEPTLLLSRDEQRLVQDTAAVHRLHLVLAERFRHSAGWDPDRLAELRQLTHGAVLLDDLRVRELRAVLAALSAAGVAAVLFKGAALAHQVYARSYVRPRGDVDLLVSAADVERIRPALAALGYEQPNEVVSDLVTTQCHFTRDDAVGVTYALDVHWKPFIAPRFADVFSTDEIGAQAEHLPALGSSAKAASLPHQLLLACIHRVAHHGDSGHLLWIWDIHLLAEALGDVRLEAALALAEERRMLSVCLRALGYAHACFGTRLSPTVHRVCEREADVAQREGLETYLAGERRLVDRAWRDLRALPDWRTRRRWLRHHLFPSPDYVRRKFGVTRAAWLPACYLYRVIAGLPRWVRPHSAR
jgi:hypothetical protein